jgi:hypothetical protein
MLVYRLTLYNPEREKVMFSFSRTNRMTLTYSVCLQVDSKQFLTGTKEEFTSPFWISYEVIAFYLKFSCMYLDTSGSHLATWEAEIKRIAV